jgi:5-phospho-D-xylono-1,4-lactonase
VFTRRLEELVIRTVMGDIAPEALGVTCSHEHLLSRPPEWMARQDPDLCIDDFAAALAEARAYAEAGGASLYEASAIDYGRDVVGLRRIAEATGLSIIACGGFNKGLWFGDQVANWTDGYLVDHLVREVTEGVGTSDVRAGCIKFGTGYNRISRDEERVIRAAARAHRRSGVPLHGHTEVGTMALEQVEVLREEGVDLSRVGFAHLLRNPDPWYLQEVARSGAFLCMDGLSKVKYFPESVRMDAILALSDGGYAGQILLGGDLARRSDLFAYEGGPGIRFVITKWAERFTRFVRWRGRPVEEAESLLNRFLVENPRRYFDVCPTY